MAASPTPPRPIEIFYSYSRKDLAHVQELLNHLGVPKRLGLIVNWHDREMTAGTEWQGQIDQYLNSADVILLMVSSDFIASNYVWDVELKRAMERHEKGEARVIPVILRPVNHWKAAPFGKLAAVPTGGLPVTRWSNQDEAFADVAAHIRKALEELRNPRSAHRHPPGRRRWANRSGASPIREMSSSRAVTRSSPTCGSGSPGDAGPP